MRISTSHNLNGQIYACFHVQKRKPSTLLTVIVRRGGQLPDFEEDIKCQELCESEICKVEGVNENNCKAGEEGGEAKGEEAISDGRSEIRQT